MSNSIYTTTSPEITDSKEKFTRLCPDCSCEIFHKTAKYRNYAHKQGKVCHDCAPKHSSPKQPNIDKNCANCAGKITVHASEDKDYNFCSHDCACEFKKQQTIENKCYKCTSHKKCEECLEKSSNQKVISLCEECNTNIGLILYCDSEKYFCTSTCMYQYKNKTRPMKCCNKCFTEIKTGQKVCKKHKRILEDIPSIKNQKKNKLIYENKIKVIEYLGGQCIGCGYNCNNLDENEMRNGIKYTVAALHTHHLNPKEKSFNISEKLKNWKQVQPELDNVILLCANCHFELEHGFTNLIKSSNGDYELIINNDFNFCEKNRYQTEYKIEGIKLLGSSCMDCGYNRHLGSLQFDHIDEKQKDFDLSKTVKKFHVYIEECKKTVLRCANCHNSRHYKKRFDISVQ